LEETDITDDEVSAGIFNETINSTTPGSIVAVNTRAVACVVTESDVCDEHVSCRGHVAWEYMCGTVFCNSTRHKDEDGSPRLNDREKMYCDVQDCACNRNLACETWLIGIFIFIVIAICVCTFAGLVSCVLDQIKCGKITPDGDVMAWDSDDTTDSSDSGL
jgi:hypothetical protein